MFKNENMNRYRLYFFIYYRKCIKRSQTINIKSDLIRDKFSSLDTLDMYFMKLRKHRYMTSRT